MPKTSQVEQIDANEHIVQRKPQGITLFPKPKADKGKKQNEPVGLEVQDGAMMMPPECLGNRNAQQWRNLGNQMGHDVGLEKGEEKPARHIAIKLTRQPNMVKLYLFDQHVFGVKNEPDKEKINDIYNILLHLLL